MLPRYLALRDRLRTGGGLYKKDRPPLLLPCGGRRSPFSITRSNLAFQVTSPGLPIRFRQRLQDSFAQQIRHVERQCNGFIAMCVNPRYSFASQALPQRVPVIAREEIARPETGNSLRPDHRTIDGGLLRVHPWLSLGFSRGLGEERAH